MGIGTKTIAYLPDKFYPFLRLQQFKTFFMEQAPAQVG